MRLCVPRRAQIPLLARSSKPSLGNGYLEQLAQHDYGQGNPNVLAQGFGCFFASTMLHETAPFQGNNEKKDDKEKIKGE